MFLLLQAKLSMQVALKDLANRYLGPLAKDDKILSQRCSKVFESEYMLQRSSLHTLLYSIILGLLLCATPNIMLGALCFEWFWWFQQKMRNESILMVTECLNTVFPGSLCPPCSCTLYMWCMWVWTSWSEKIVLQWMYMLHAIALCVPILVWKVSEVCKFQGCGFDIFPRDLVIVQYHHSMSRI